MSKKAAYSPTPATVPQQLTLGDVQNLLHQIRAVRDKQLYLSDGCHTFREWCMNRFGERLGAWLEETL